MTFLLYDHIELDERASKNLKVWKVWHLVLYILAAIAGVVNFVFLHNTMQLVGGNCVLFPRQLEFHWVDLPITPNTTETKLDEDAQNDTKLNENAQVGSAANSSRVKRDIDDDDNEVRVLRFDNGTAITGNTTHHLMLDTSRTLFENNSDCDFAEFMPLLSTIFACVWITFFTMCPSGGRARAGLQQPWRILAPALLFALVMVGLTGHSFTITNQGMHALCAAFSEVTNSTTCSSADPFLESSWNATMGLSRRVGSTRAASAAVLAAWAIAAALLLARCLAAPDFEVIHTGVQLKDPHQKLTPYLKKSKSRHSRSSVGSPTKRDTISVRSEPTATTELVSASIEHGHDSVPTSLTTTPAKRNNFDQTDDIIETANI